MGCESTPDVTVEGKRDGVGIARENAKLRMLP